MCLRMQIEKEREREMSEIEGEKGREFECLFVSLRLSYFLHYVLFDGRHELRVTPVLQTASSFGLRLLHHGRSFLRKHGLHGPARSCKHHGGQHSSHCISDTWLVRCLHRDGGAG